MQMVGNFKIKLIKIEPVDLEKTCDNWQETFNQMFDQNKSLREQLQEYREQAQLTEVGRLTRMFENIDFGIKQTFFQIRGVTN